MAVLQSLYYFYIIHAICLYYHNFGRHRLSILFWTVIIMLIITDVIMLQANNTYSIETEVRSYRLNDRMHTALI